MILSNLLINVELSSLSTHDLPLQHIYSDKSTFWLTTGLYPQSIVLVQPRRAVSSVAITSIGAKYVERTAQHLLRKAKLYCTLFKLTSSYVVSLRCIYYDLLRYRSITVHTSERGLYNTFSQIAASVASAPGPATEVPAAAAGKAAMPATAVTAGAGAGVLGLTPSLQETVITFPSTTTKFVKIEFENGYGPHVAVSSIVIN